MKLDPCESETSRVTTMADIQAIAKQFTDFYYATFDSNRAQLGSLYVRCHRCASCRLPPEILIHA